MKNILAVMPIDSDYFCDEISKAAGENKVKFVFAKDVEQSDVDNADIVIGNVPPKFLNEQKIGFMQLTSAGADAYVKEGILSRDTVLCCSTGAYSQTVAEHALASTLMLIKNLHLYRDDQMNSKWTDEGDTSSVDGATVLVMGLGDIGRYYARMVKALGAYVIGVNRRGGNKPEFVDELYTTDQFDKIVPRADIIMSILPGTASTEYFYTIERFKLMKNSAVFLNMGRGNAVSADVLYEALTNGYIRSAAVDVFEKEPLDSSSKLWSLKNLAITPHASGFFHLPATIRRVTDICASNLNSYLNGGELKNIIDYESGYKK